MASSNSTTGVDNTFRKKFDTEEYRKREKKESDRCKSRSKGSPYMQRAPLKHRDYHVDLESSFGQDTVFGKLFGSHKWEKKHQKTLGMSMRVKRSSLQEVQERIEALKKWKTLGTFTEQDLDEGIQKQQEEEEVIKWLRREKKKEKKKGKVMEEELEIDPEVAEMMGFGGFGSLRKS